MQNCASYRFSILAAKQFCETDNHRVFGPSTTLVDDLECDLTSVDTNPGDTATRNKLFAFAAAQ